MAEVERPPLLHLKGGYNDVYLCAKDPLGSEVLLHIFKLTVFLLKICLPITVNIIGYKCSIWLTPWKLKKKMQ